MSNPETGSVWPPPPTAMQAVSTPFKTLFLYVKGSVPNFRTGTLTLTPQGIDIQGKSVVRNEIQVPILIVCLLLRVGWLIAYLLMEYAFRRDETLSVNWEQVREVVVRERKQQVCFVYDAPNYKGVVKTFSLTTRVELPLYDLVVTEAKERVPNRVREGKLRSWTSPKIWVALGGFCIVMIIVLLMSLTGSLSH